MCGHSWGRECYIHVVINRKKTVEIFPQNQKPKQQKGHNVYLMNIWRKI